MILLRAKPIELELLLQLKTSLKELTDEELRFCITDRTIEDFHINLKVPGKLLPKRIRGGILLVDTTYEMR